MKRLRVTIFRSSDAWELESFTANHCDITTNSSNFYNCKTSERSVQSYFDKVIPAEMMNFTIVAGRITVFYREGVEIEIVRIND